MNEDSVRPEDAEDETPADVLDETPLSKELAKERAAEAVERVKESAKEITVKPLRDAVGSYFYRGIDALIGFAEGLSGEKDLRGKKK